MTLSRPSVLFIFGYGSFTRCILHLIEKKANQLGMDYWIVDRDDSNLINKTKNVIPPLHFGGSSSIVNFSFLVYQLKGGFTN